MFRILDYFFPSKKRLNAELNEILSDIQPLTEKLIKWDKKELELMSLIQRNREVSTFKKYTEGILCSIYHEDMAAYRWKAVSSMSDYEVCAVITRKYTFKYIIQKSGASMYIDDKFLGELKNDNYIYATKRNRIAHISIDDSEWWGITVQDKKLGSLANINRARDVNPRAFYLGPPLNDVEEAIFLCISLYIIIRDTKDDRKLRFR